LGIATWVHLVHVRGENQIDAAVPKKGKVPLPIARIAVQVLARPELEGIHEDGNGDEVRLLTDQIHEGEVPFVEETHGGNESQAGTLAPTGLESS
jgi:hypothetical protein